MRKNLAEATPLLIGLGLFLLGAGSVWMTFSGWSGARVAAEELLQRKQSSILALPEGMEKINHDITALQKASRQLKKELQVLTEPGEAAWGLGQPWSVDPGQWKDRLIEANDRIREESGAAGQSGRVILAPEFYLGFEEYRQKSPSPAQVPALARQLAVSQRLMDHLLACRREVAEPFPTPCVLKKWKVPGVAAETSGGTPASPPEKSTATPASFLRETYEINLECSPEILADLLRRLAGDPWILIPTNLVVENEQTSFPKRAEFEKLFKNPAGVPGANEGQIIPSAKAPLLLVLAGKEKLRVSLTVDFAGWPPATPVAAPLPEPAKEGS